MICVCSMICDFSFFDLWMSTQSMVLELVTGVIMKASKKHSNSDFLRAHRSQSITSALNDAGGQTTRMDTGKEYYPYTQKKRPTVTN
ncbi:hypothetical protein RHMOL_Rhmol08G0009400 [Rhododendron molle]|uniref:Uncharacterized protein n=1 Tax=Rhododendron molle TaxID=49168 RepID=A0ACC0MID0_RHOML|nr:hypothetical protein RHMOL_Rhmol08G0009400 [Rhododendron molle]